jgi:hypothetical protein
MPLLLFPWFFRTKSCLLFGRASTRAEVSLSPSAYHVAGGIPPTLSNLFMYVARYGHRKLNTADLVLQPTVCICCLHRELQVACKKRHLAQGRDAPQNILVEI